MKIMQLVLLLLMPALLYSQTSSQILPSQELLQSGVVLGTEREHHFSMRIEALGRDFSGYIADQTTDLFRNPAYFAHIDEPILWGEISRFEPPSGRSSALSRTSGNVSSSLADIRFGYAKNFGILLRGNYFSQPQHTRTLFEGFDTFDETRDIKNRNRSGEVGLSFGFSISGSLLGGISYTFGIEDALQASNTSSMRTLTRYNSTRYDSTFSLFERVYENENTDHSNIVQLGLIWNKARGKTWETVATFENFEADLLDEREERRNSIQYILELDSEALNPTISMDGRLDVGRSDFSRHENFFSS